jgi:hypothetical protein
VKLSVPGKMQGGVVRRAGMPSQRLFAGSPRMAVTLRGFLRAALLGKVAARSRFGEAHFVSRMWAKRLVGTRFLPGAGAGGGSNGRRSGSGSRDQLG